MSNRTVFAGVYNALDFAYGYGEVPALSVTIGTTATGSGTLTLQNGFIQVTGLEGPISVLSTTAPVNVGSNSGLDSSITPTAVAAGTNGVPNTATLTGSFTFLHGTGDPVSSATLGLQEAINYAASLSSTLGAQVNITRSWYQAGGTLAIVQACTLPTNGTVRIFDTTTNQFYQQRAAAVTLLAAPATPTSATVASLTTTGTWTNVTTYVKFAYVTAAGGISVPSSEYSFTATNLKAIGGSGPAAATGAVGYLVGIGTTTNTEWILPPTSTTGTTVQCGPIVAFKIGTSFTSPTLLTTANATMMVASNAFTSVQPQPFAAVPAAQVFQTIFPPFANIATVTAGTAVEAARVDLPTGFLNQIGRTLRITLTASFTPGSTATLIPSWLLYSTYGQTSITAWTVTTAATSGTTQSNLKVTLEITTAATGTTGTIEGHGVMIYQSATGSAPAALAAMDSVTAASSAIDLTLQDTLSFTINSGTANLTNFRVRQLFVEVLA